MPDSGIADVVIVDAPSGCTAGQAFCDDFQDGNTDGWTAIEQTTSTAGTWGVGSDTGPNGAMTQTVQQTAMTANHHYFVASGATGGPWGDQTVTAWVKPTGAIADDTMKVGICARMSSTDGSNTQLSGYCVFLRADGTAPSGRLQLSRKLPGAGESITSMAQQTTGLPLFASGTWYKVGLKVAGSPAKVTVLLNDAAVFEWTDPADGGMPANPTGYPGLVTRRSTAATTMPVTANFDDVTLTSP